MKDPAVTTFKEQLVPLNEERARLTKGSGIVSREIQKIDKKLKDENLSKEDRFNLIIDRRAYLDSRSNYQKRLESLRQEVKPIESKIDQIEQLKNQKLDNLKKDE